MYKIETMNMKNFTSNVQNRIHQFVINKTKFVVVDTKQYGNVLFLHTSKKGEFNLNILKILWLYHKYDCKALTTCYPAKHHQIRPKLAKRLNILFKDTIYSIYWVWYYTRANEYRIDVSANEEKRMYNA